ncbi:MAG: hypothetical protein ACR2P0_05130 [Acidimicrobiales bacterium]
MMDPGELAKRLHGGALQAFYAAALTLEGDEPDVERAVGILRQGALQLGGVIDDLDEAAAGSADSSGH